jgi:predicted flap endonuclease-1-like 5' DNA nuclease
MSLLFRIVTATHANGTHHKLALDALEHLASPAAERWERLFLEHVALYLQASKAPDVEFKDFRNHVLHVRDGYWGGAPERVANWYGYLVEALKARRWSEAVYCAGLLSHYYTDPIHPFHTAQSEAENNIHRAVEWSISKSYDDLRQIGEARFSDLRVVPGDGPEWLKDMVCRGAETSNRQYEKLIAHYNFRSGVVDPPSGLDEVARGLVAELIRYATVGYAAILDRAFAEAAVEPPEVDLTVDTFLAALKIPIKLVVRKMADTAERRLVERMYDELIATGRVEENLPEDDRVVRDLHAREVLSARAAAQTEQRAERLAPAREAPAPLSALRRAPAPKPAAAAAAGVTAETDSLASPLAALHAGTAIRTKAAPRPDTAPRFRLAEGDDIEAAPAIGPKTADRLRAVGLHLVSDLLAAKPEQVASVLDLRHVSPATVTDWQDEARLVCAVPDLRGTQAQLLVGAGYRTVDDLAAAEPAALLTAILRFVQTSEGQRVLRDGRPPDLEKVLAWVANAGAARAA